MLSQITKRSSFSWWNDIPLCIYTTSALSSHPLMDTSAVSIPWLLNIPHHARNMGVQIFLWGCDCIFFVYIPKAGSYGSSIFQLFRDLHTLLLGGYTNLHSSQQCIRVSFPPHPPNTYHFLSLVYTFLLLLLFFIFQLQFTFNVILC